MIRWDQVSVVEDRTPILVGIDLEVATGQWMSIVGPNGAGKTTLLRTVTNPPPGLTGSVEVSGHDARSMRTRDLARTVAAVPQHPVIPAGFRVFDYVLLGRVPHQDLRCSPSRHDRERVVAVLQRLDLDGLAGRRIETLSGGERQRVVLARAVAQEAPLLVLDEPTTALDIGHQLEVLELVDDLRREHGLTVVSTVHDLTVAGQFADRVAVLSGGRLVTEGRPADVLVPQVIGDHWGVEATCVVDEHGGVTVTVRRRREPISDRATERP